MYDASKVLARNYLGFPSHTPEVQTIPGSNNPIEYLHISYRISMMAKSKAVNTFYDLYIRPYGNVITIVGFIIVFVLLVVTIVNYNNAATMNQMSKNIANLATQGNTFVPNSGKIVSGFATGNGGEIQVMFFNVDWCPHCVKAKPEWEKFVNKYDGQTQNGYLISCVGGAAGINCTNSDDPNVSQLINQYKVEYYPTLIFIQNGQEIKFDGKVTMDNMEQFMKTI